MKFYLPLTLSALSFLFFSVDASAQATLSTASINFGSATVSTEIPLAVTITNGGNSPVTIQSISLTGANPSDFGFNNTCGTIPANGTCQFGVAFQPSALGQLSATLTVTDTNANTIGTVAFSGSSVLATWTPTSLSFGSEAVGTPTAPQLITLTNPSFGGTITAFSSIVVSSQAGGTQDPNFPISTTCSSPLPVNGTCTVSMRFDPQTTGPFSTNLWISFTSDGTPQIIQVPVTGAGTTVVPAITANPTALTFGSVIEGVTSSAQTVTLLNGATSAVTFANIGSANSAFGTTSTCSTTLPLPAGQSCTISVTFDPTTSGAASATLTATYSVNSGPTETTTVPLSGTGVLPPLSANVSTLNFGSVVETFCLGSPGNYTDQ